jgi:sulfur carrier protein ThiS
MKVKILVLGRSAYHADVSSGSTIQDALDSANVNTQGYTLSLNGLGASPETGVNEHDVICCTPKVVGGAAA